MKTDALFYELFRFDPQSLLRLLGLNLPSRYTFESLTAKTTEKRLDGFFRSLDGHGPHLFVEVQGYRDSKIYWRLFREICTYYEQRAETTPFIAVVLFLDPKYDPGAFPRACVEPCRFIRANLLECLAAVGERPSVLTVLKPLGLANRAALPQAVQGWKAELEALDLPAEQARRLEGLLEYSILQRFPKLTLKEVRLMLRLTPLEKTVAGQELMQMGREEGLEEGLKKGELIGQIRMAQRVLKQPLSAPEALARQSIEELRSLLQHLEAELSRPG